MADHRNISITKPYFDDQEAKAVAEVIASGWVVQGPKVREFEQLFEDFQLCRHAIATTSATTALHLALLAVGISTGDEVIVPAFTHPATANVVMYLGAQPVFVDVRLPDCNIDTSQIENKITTKTKAIIPVHLFGLAADMAPVMELANEYGLTVVEDAACAHGAEYNGKRVGTFGACGAFSFHPRKPITTGEGGMLTTDNDEIADRVRTLRSHGESVSDEVRHTADEIIYPDYVALGFNYRMTDIQAALGVEQMKKLPYILDERRGIASQYDTLLSGPVRDGYFVVPPSPSGFLHSYQSYVIFLGEKVGEKRDVLSNKLQNVGIATRKGTYNVAGTKYYRETFGITEDEFPNSVLADKRTLALPLYPGMNGEDIHYVAEKLHDLIRSL